MHKFFLEIVTLTRLNTHYGNIGLGKLITRIWYGTILSIYRTLLNYLKNETVVWLQRFYILQSVQKVNKRIFTLKIIALIQYFNIIQTVLFPTIKSSN